MNPEDDMPSEEIIDKRLTVNRFSETHWSQVLLAAQADSDQSQQAKEQLCATYWRPIYGFLRRTGKTRHDAEDLTQQFFVRLLNSNAFSQADPAKGRFRNFLLGALKHFLIDESRKASTQKRGGKINFTSIEFSDSEEEHLQQLDPGLSADQVYDRRWAATLLDLAFQRLRADFAAAGQLDRFEVLKSFLSEEADDGDYDRVSHQLGMTRKAVGVAVHRLRQRYQQLVRSEVADTLVDSGQVEEELRELFR